jgi:hypothetical protein
MTLSYASEPQRFKRYGFTLLAMALAAYIWTISLETAWGSRVLTLVFAVWSVRFLVDHQFHVDVQSGTVTREKLLFGHLVGAVHWPLEEFASVSLDHDQRVDKGATLYVCLRRQNGKLLHVCAYDESRLAENAAEELAEATGLKNEARA